MKVLCTCRHNFLHKIIYFLLFLGAIAHVTNYYRTSLSFHIIDLNCNGSEETVLDCSYNNIEQHSCQLYEIASVQCQGIKLLIH